MSKLLGILNEPLVDCLVVVALCSLAFIYLPIDVLRGTPASGGDTGSHYWPLYVLIKFAIPNFTYPVLNPGNNLGEPQLVHYFPTPFFIMALLVPFVGVIGRAFNVGTILPIIVNPACVYLFFSLSGAPRKIGMVAAAFSLFVIYNESYSMWGGNTLSLLAGQFAHQYALCFFMLAAGQFNRELRTRSSHYASAILFALTITSHPYVGLIVPFYVGIRSLLEIDVSLRERIWRAFYATALSFVLSAWCIVPMVLNNSWTTPLPMTWIFDDWVKQVLPKILWPIGGTLVVVLILLLVIRGIQRQVIPISRELLSLLGITLIYGGLYFAMPKLGLVDVRVLPQMYLFSATIAGGLLGAALLALPSFGPSIASLVVCGASLYWTTLHVDRFPIWNKWNYSGWYTKNVYPQLSRIYKKLDGDYSMPRVAWEHADVNDRGGSLRVFEMLPYFTGRSTLESLYTQSTIAAPMVYYLQSLYSQRPSCPFRQYRCGSFNLQQAEDKLRLLGAGELILSDKKSTDAAKQNSYLKPVITSGAWTLFSIEGVSLVEVLNSKPFFVSSDDWKQRFFEWFTNYSRGTPHLIATTTRDEAAVEELRKASEQNIDETLKCEPSLHVHYNRLELSTNCPGRFHLIKFAFHPNWAVDSGEKLFNTSPGMLGVVPKSQKLVIRFGPSLSWKLAWTISLFTFLGSLAMIAKATFFRKKGPRSAT